MPTMCLLGAVIVIFFMFSKLLGELDPTLERAGGSLGF